MCWKIIIFNLRQTGSFNVTDHFLTTFYYVEKRNGILRKNRGEEFEKSYVPLHGGRGVKNYQYHAYVINEWSLKVICVPSVPDLYWIPACIKADYLGGTLLNGIWALQDMRHDVLGCTLTNWDPSSEKLEHREFDKID